MSGHFSPATFHGRLVLHARTLPRSTLEAALRITSRKCIIIIIIGVTLAQWTTLGESAAVSGRPTPME